MRASERAAGIGRAGMVGEGKRVEVRRQCGHVWRGEEWPGPHGSDGASNSTGMRRVRRGSGWGRVRESGRRIWQGVALNGLESLEMRARGRRAKSEGIRLLAEKEDPCRNLVYRSAAGGGAGLPRCEYVGLRLRLQARGEEGASGVRVGR